MKIFYIAFLAIFIAGCANTSTYRGGVGAYQDYDGFQDYLNRYSPTSSADKKYYYDDNTYSSGYEGGASFSDKARQDSQGASNAQTTREPIVKTYNNEPAKVDSSDNTKTDSSDSAKIQSSIPPSENIRLGEARDSEAVQRATMKPYQVNGKWYYPQKVSIGETYDGIASWYGPDFHAKQTSNGEIYDMNLHTAAHKTLPMNTLVKVVSLDTNRSTIVRINDRGPFVEGRIIDLSQAAAKDIDMIKTGTARVNIEVIGFGGIVSDEAASSSTLIKDMVESKEFKEEFKTGAVAKTVEGGNFAVQIGAFRRENGAEIFKDSHKYDKYDTIIKKGDFQNEPIYRVFVSGFKSEEEARDFIRNNQIDGFVIRD